MKKDFLAIPDFTTEEIKETFQLALDMKSGKNSPITIPASAHAPTITSSSFKSSLSLFM